MSSMRALSVLLVIIFAAVPAAATEAVGDGLDVVLDSTQHWVGDNDVLMSVYDASGETWRVRAGPCWSR